MQWPVGGWGVALSLSPPISTVSTVFQRSRLQSSFRAAPCRVIVYPNGAFFTCFPPDTTEIQLLLMEWRVCVGTLLNPITPALFVEHVLRVLDPFR